MAPISGKLVTGDTPVEVLTTADVDARIEAYLNALLPTRGDLLVRTATGLNRLALGPNGYVVGSNGTDVVYGVTGGGGGGPATQIQESGGTILPIGPIGASESLVRNIDPGTGQPRVAGRPIGLIPFKVAHPGVLENDTDAWMAINVVPINTDIGCDLSVPSAIKVFYVIRYMASSPGIEFKFADTDTISTWGGWGALAGSGGQASKNALGNNPLDWGAAGWGHANTKMLFLYANHDGDLPFTLCFRRYPAGSGVARVDSGSFVVILRSKEGWVPE